MDYVTSDALFQMLRREFPSLAEHTIQSIINYSRNNVNLCIEACRKAAANQVLERPQASSSVSPVDIAPRRSPMRNATDLGFFIPENDGPPEWRMTPPDPGYDVRITALANPRVQANGSPPTYNHIPASVTTADYHSDRHRLCLNAHRHSESDVFANVQSTGYSLRPPGQRLSGGGHATHSTSQSPLRRSPPVNGLGQLNIVTSEDANIDDQWTQATASDGTQQASLFQSPVPQPPSIVVPPPQLLRFGSEIATRSSGARNAVSDEVLAQILVTQQHSNLDKLRQTTESTESLLNELHIEEARLADEIRDMKKRKLAEGGGVLGNSTARELDKLKLENARLRDEVVNLQKQADALTAVAPLTRTGSNVGNLMQPVSLPPPPPYDSQLRGCPLPTNSSTPATPGGTASSQPRASMPATPPATSLRPKFDGQPPRIILRTMQPQTPPSLFTGQLAGQLPTQTQQPLSPPPIRPDPRSGAPIPPFRPDPRNGAPPLPPRRMEAAQPPAHLDEGENWSCSACTFLNHPTLSTCEICDTPRM